MSKICLIMAQNVKVSPDNLRRRIAALAAERNVGAFFPTTASVGLTEYEGRSFICSVSDDFMYDNCERRLFPDDCWYNGTRSSTPFAECMNSVCDIVRCAADCSTEVELFIGDCGQCPLAEFEPVSVRLERLHKTLAHKRGKIRKRRTNNGEHNMFSGLLVCADCGSNLHFHFNQGNPEIKYFNCSNYKGNRASVPLPIMSVWTSWRKWCWERYGA